MKKLVILVILCSFSAHAMEKKFSPKKSMPDSHKKITFEYKSENTWKALAPEKFFAQYTPKRSYVITPSHESINDDNADIRVTLWMDGHIAYIHYEAVTPYSFKKIEMFYNHVHPKKLDAEIAQDKKIAKKVASQILEEFLKQRNDLERNIIIKKI